MQRLEMQHIKQQMQNNGLKAIKVKGHNAFITDTTIVDSIVVSQWVFFYSFASSSCHCLSESIIAAFRLLFPPTLLV